MNKEALLYAMREYEKKLKELMSEEEFYKFSIKLAKEMFKIDVDSIEDSDFRNFCIDHMDEITR